MSPEQWVSLIIERGAELRAVGALSISVDGASVTLAPADPVMPTAGPVPPGPPERPAIDPFEDPETFGGILPGYVFPATPPGALE